MKVTLLSIIILFSALSRLCAQYFEHSFPRGVKKIDIPFEYENNFIIINLVFNRIFPLKFIFDTGAEHTILTRREITDLLQIDYHKRFSIMGADMQTELYAYLARGIHLKLNNAEFPNRSILVLEDDYFQFEQYAGVAVHGILGSDLFRRYVVEINYRRQIISLHDPIDFSPPRSRFVEYPLEFNRHKPYLFACAHFPDDTMVRTKLLLDTGASLALLLYTDTHPGLQLPEKVIRSNIGVGLGGYLEGFLGRINRLELAEFSFNGVITNFQEMRPRADTAFLFNRNGILGNQILSRFIVIIDYVHGRLYLLPEKGYREKFHYDRSGLSLVAGGPRLNIYTVYQVVPGSPAYEAGIRENDMLRTFNGLPASFFSLADITRRLQGRPGKRIRITLDRDGERIKTQFRLRDLI
jgi:hypothetical protein